MKKYWSEYINRYDSFTYEFQIPITSKNAQSQILSFDIEFLKNGEELALFIFNQKNFIRNYKNTREKSFFTEKNDWINLLGLDQYKNDIWKEMSIFVPDIKNGVIELIKIPFHHKSGINRFIEIGNYSDLIWSELKNLNYWDSIISLSIFSTSNIWWDEIDFTRFENEIYPQKLDKPIDNRPFAYRITPRFNSFLRKMKSKVYELGGKVILEEYISKHVTEDGILLDGKIIYQEDIDEGRVQLP